MGLFTERIALIISADAGGAVRPLGQLESSAKQAETSFDKMAKSMGLSASTLKTGLVAGATALVGTGLVSFLKDSVVGLADAAKAAGDLAAATGSNVETVSRMEAALQDAGVSAEQAATMLTKFTTTAGSTKGAASLKALNVELVKGKNGATDYAATMVEAVDAIGRLGDSSERNRRLVELFGKAGAKAFQDLLNSGKTFRQAMDEISSTRIITGETLADAQAFDEALDAAKASAQGLSRAVGRELLPMVTTLLGAFAPLVDTLGKIPPEFIEVTAAAVLLSKALKTTLVTGALSAVASSAPLVIGALTSVRTALALTAIAAVDLSAALLANPIGLVAAGLVAALVSVRMFNDGLKATSVEIQTLIDQGKSFEVAWGTALGVTQENLGKLRVDPMLGPVMEAQEQNFKDTAAAAGDLAEAFDTTAVKTSEYAASLEAVHTATTLLNEDFISAEDAADRAARAMGDLNLKLTDNGNLTRDSKAAIREAVAAQADYIDKLVESGASAETVKAKNDKWAESLYASAAAAGVSKRDVDKYLASLGFIPDEVTTKVLANTLSAEDNIETIRDKINALPDSVKIPVYIKAIIQNPGAFAKVERLMNENRSVAPAPPIPQPRVIQFNVPSGPTVGGRATVPVTIANTYNITVPGSGSPAVTAREIERYIRRAGDRRQLSVTA